MPRRQCPARFHGYTRVAEPAGYRSFKRSFEERSDLNADPTRARQAALGDRELASEFQDNLARGTEIGALQV